MQDNSWEDDRTEMIKAWGGDIPSIANIVSKLSKPAFNLAHKILLNKEDAEDCLQDAFCRLWMVKNQFQGKSSLKTYFFKIVINSCFAILKKRPDVKVEDFDNVDHDSMVIEHHYSNVENNLVSLDIKNALLALTPKQRMAIVLWTYFDFTASEIGQMMEMNKNSVDQLLFRAKQQLKSVLNGRAK